MKRLTNNVSEYDTIPWGTLKEYECNTLKQGHQRDIQKLKNAITNRGFNFPFYTWHGHRFIIDGAGRVAALKELEAEGYTIPDLPVIEIAAATIQDAKALVLQASSEHGQTTQESFAAFAEDLDLASMLDEISFPDIDLGPPTLLAPEDEDLDDIPAPPDDPRTKLGDLYEIGPHRLVCGDSTQLSDIERLLNSTKADLLLTDPPYGVAYAGKNQFLNAKDKGNRIQKEIENDHCTPEELKAFCTEVFTNAFTALADVSSYYVFTPSGEQMLMILLALHECGLMVKHHLVWLKNNHVLGRSDYNYKHEPIIYGWKQGGTHKFYATEHKVSVLEFDKPLKSDLHPTMKPVALLEELITNSTPKDGSVLDLFGGSGSTMVAAQQTGRKAYLSEIDPHYCDVIVDRMRKLYPDIPVKLNGDLTQE